MKIQCIVALLGLLVVECPASPEPLIGPNHAVKDPPWLAATSNAIEEPPASAKTRLMPPWLALSTDAIPATVASTNEPSSPLWLALEPGHRLSIVGALDEHGILPRIKPVRDYSQQLGPNGGISVIVISHEGARLAGAAVTFESGGADLLTANPYGRGKVTSLTVRTDSSGVATVYIRPLEPAH